MLELYEHNEETYERIVNFFHKKQKVACVQPTGTGKSYIVLKLIEDNPESFFVIVSPSAYILSQLKNHANESDIDVSKCEFVTYSKLSQQDEKGIKELKVDYIVLDEFHRAGAKEWGIGVQKLLSMHEDAKVLGTSATPIRYLDSLRNMADELFNNNFAVNMSLADAIREKILPLPVYVTSYYKFSGEIARLERKAEQSKNIRLKMVLLGKIKKAKSMVTQLDCGLETIFVRHMKNRSGKYIIFCPSIEKLKKSVSESKDWFCKVNGKIHTYSVHTGNSESNEQFERFRDDNDPDVLKLLFCVDMLNEGIHVKNIDGVIMLRSTQSANVFYQQLGRALSCSVSSPVIFDIVNNYETGDTANQYSQIMGMKNNRFESRDDDNIEFELYDYVKDVREILTELHLSFEGAWDVVFDAVCEFKGKYERFPYYDEKYDGFHIGNWCANQRVLRKKGVLGVDRVQKLDSIDFVWSQDEEKWEQNYKLLSLFKEKHGRFPKRSDAAHDETVSVLYNWMLNQKQKFKNNDMPDLHVKKFNDLGFELRIVPMAEVWENNYNTLKTFRDENGRFPVVTDVRKNLIKSNVYKWMNLQREKYRKGTLNAEKISKLNEIGFVWNKAETVKNEKLELLKEFMEKYGRPPKSKEKYKGKTIGYLACHAENQSF